MTEKRPHAELAIKFYSDTKMKCWVWDEDSRRWLDIGKPAWNVIRIYEVSETKPTKPPKKRVTMAGITFNAPETETPNMGARYWLANVESTVEFAWNGNLIDQQWLAAGLIHLDRENARLHAQALRELNRQLCGMEDAA